MLLEAVVHDSVDHLLDQAVRDRVSEKMAEADTNHCLAILCKTKQHQINTYLPVCLSTCLGTMQYLPENSNNSSMNP